MNEDSIVSKVFNYHYQCKNVGLTSESIRVSTVVTRFLVKRPEDLPQVVINPWLSLHSTERKSFYCKAWKTVSIHTLILPMKIEINYKFYG
ncbi:hypothetical protein, partial [Leptolyngbya ectocarpi]|uniref:hypothetical protein n=1 Tax=Leptolyngbya ectocarpi TaxID=1202 RepID=UPI001D132C29